MCVGSSPWGGSGRVPGNGGHLLWPPHPPTALPRQCYEHTLVYEKEVTKFCLAHGHHCTIIDRKNASPPLKPPGHRCVAVAYLSLALTNHLPDSELR